MNVCILYNTKISYIKTIQSEIKLKAFNAIILLNYLRYNIDYANFIKSIIKISKYIVNETIYKVLFYINLIVYIYSISNKDKAYRNKHSILKGILYKNSLF